MNLQKFFKLSKKFEKNLQKLNLLFIFIFLNVWDFVISREFLNAMILGFFMFGPVTFLWYLGSIRVVAFLTLISILEFTIMLVLILQGFELGGFDTTLKSVFWFPYLLMAGVNGFWGLKIYSEHKENKSYKTA